MWEHDENVLYDVMYLYHVKRMMAKWRWEMCFVFIWKMSAYLQLDPKLESLSAKKDQKQKNCSKQETKVRSSRF